MKFLEEKNIQRKLVFLNALRIVILSVLLLVVVVLALVVETTFPFLPIVAALGTAVLFSAAAFALFSRINYRVVFYLQALVDITVITFLVYYSGGIASPFYFLYILPIIIAAMFLSRRDTLYIATLSYIIFGVLSDLIYLDIIPYYPLMASVNITLNVFIYNLVMSFIAFSSIAILSSFYFERIRRTGAELKNTRENLKDLVMLNSMVLERMENGFIISDSTGVIISYNNKAQALLKLHSGSNILHILSPSPRTNGKNIHQDASFGKKYYFEIEVHERILGVSYSVIEKIYSFDEVYVFIITDLTEKREFENKLKQKEHLALIGEMSAGIAHEIRNPLASISGSVQFLSKELEVDPEFKHLMEIIVKESSRLSNSIELFLDYAKSTPLEIARFDLSRAVDDVTELVAINHPEIKIVKNYSEGNAIRADFKQINQVIWNLINNAVKALEGKSGTIEATIYNNEEELYLSIKDNGVGIARENMKKIFTPFHSRFTSGIGLGMAIVKRIVDEHHFEISIKSEKDIGTEVIICFNTPEK